MKYSEVLRTAMIMDGITQEQMARRLCFKSHSALSNAAGRKTGMRIDLWIRAMNAMGYQIVARRADGEFLVTEQ